MIQSYFIPGRGLYKCKNGLQWVQFLQSEQMNEVMRTNLKIRRIYQWGDIRNLQVYSM